MASKSNRVKKFKHTSKHTTNNDHDPVRVLYVSNLERCPFTVTQGSLQNYFEKAGPVEKVAIVRKLGHSYAFVTFENAADASKVLSDRSFNQTMKIRKADIWHQPKNDSNGSYGLLVLNNDCLFHIFSFLKPIDAVNLAETDDRILLVAQLHFKKYSHFDCDWIPNNLQNKVVDRLYRHIGPYVQSLDFSHNFFSMSVSKTFAMFSKYFSNVESLRLSNIQLRQKLNAEYKRFFDNIRKLELNNCLIADHIIAELFKEPTSNLEHLCLYDCGSIRGKFLQKLTNLKTLKIRSCYELVEHDLQRGLRSNPNLKEFTLTRCNVKFTCKAVSYLQNLDTLVIDPYDCHASQLDKLLQLNQLTKLNLKCMLGSDIDSFLTKLGRKDMLEELEIHHMFIGEKTIEAFESFKKLKVLNLKSPINNIEEKFLKRMPLVLPELKSFTYKNSTITIENILMLIKQLKQLEFIDISAIGTVTMEEIAKIVDVLKTNLNRPLLHVIVSDESFYLNADWGKDPFIIQNKCIVDIAIQSSQPSDMAYCDSDSDAVSDTDSDDSFGFDSSDYSDKGWSK